MFHPVTHKEGPMKGRADSRYSVALEWCGHSVQHYVARFCGDWIGSSRFRSSAVMLAIGHDAARRGCADIVEQVQA